MGKSRRSRRRGAQRSHFVPNTRIDADGHKHTPESRRPNSSACVPESRSHSRPFLRSSFPHLRTATAHACAAPGRSPAPLRTADMRTADPRADPIFAIVSIRQVPSVYPHGLTRRTVPFTQGRPASINTQMTGKNTSVETCISVQGRPASINTQMTTRLPPLPFSDYSPNLDPEALLCHQFTRSA